jgi:hypothetical protein
MLTPSYLKKIIKYCPLSGKLYWKKRTEFHFIDGLVSSKIKAKRFNSSFANKEAFTAKSQGYCVSNVGGQMLKAHRVAWAVYYGEWPDGFLDHINRVRHDNRICNLRVSTRAQNNSNVSTGKNSTSQFLGVYWDKARGKWVANIKINGKSKFLGRFREEKDAAIAYDNKAFEAYGQFASLNFPKTIQ